MAEKPKAKKGDKVKIHFTGKLDDGTQFDATKKDQPLEFVLGSGKVLAGLDEAIAGMAVGEKKTTKVPPEKGFGPRREDLTFDAPRKEFPDDLKQGEAIQVSQPDGKKFFAVVVEIGKDKVTLDVNNLLAGKTLTFEIELVDIVN